MISTVVAAYDGSQSAKRAFEYALDLAEAFEARLHVVSVARPAEPPTSVETQALLESATEHFEADFTRFREAAKQKGVVLTAEVVVGHPAEQIVRVAGHEKADVIIMGHRGRSALARWLLGSISKRVLSYAPCTVTVVR